LSRVDHKPGALVHADAGAVSESRSATLLRYLKAAVPPPARRSVRRLMRAGRRLATWRQHPPSSGDGDPVSCPPSIAVESTPEPPVAPPTRSEILLAALSPDARIVEIGPSFSPIAPKSEGRNTKSIDHLTREGLIAKYTGHPGVDVNRIEQVDYLWTEGFLSDAVPSAEHGTFDAFIASHVIEHTPDLVAFLESAEKLLQPEGVVVLAVPDKRYCFDYFQPLTTTGQLLEAHADRRSRHTRPIAFDHIAYATANDGICAWGQHPSKDLTFMHRLEDANALFTTIKDDPNYVDLHAWHFVPASFELLLLELARLGQTDWRVDRTTASVGCEFFAWLRRGGAACAAAYSFDELAAERLRLLKRTLLETREQIDWLLAGEAHLAT